MNLFTQAASAPKPTVASKAKSDEPVVVTRQEVSDAVDQFVELKKEAKENKLKTEAAVGTIMPLAMQIYASRLTDAGKMVSQLKLRNEIHQISLIVQDRSGRYPVSEEQKQELARLLGEKTAKSMMVDATEYSFNSDVLRLPKVMAALSGKIMELVADGVLTEEQASKLVVAEQHEVFKADLGGRLPQLCGADAEKVGLVVAALGSNIVAYLTS